MSGIFVRQPNGSRNAFSPGQRLGEGASGKVYCIPSQPGHAAKIYHTLKEADEHREKVVAMLGHRPRLDCVVVGGKRFHQIAWPDRLLEDGAGRFIGFTMPEIDFASSRPFESVLQKVGRRALNIPERYDLRIALATNLASVFTELHKVGHFMIDMKPENLRFYPGQSLLAVVDTDGFSIKGDKKRYPSQQFTDNYIAPEGKGRSPAMMAKPQDEFALAVIIFQLFNNGIHPFSGKVAAGSSARSEIQEHIYANMFAYGRQPHDILLPSPYSIHNGFLDETSDLFNRAFRIGQRPSAREWRDHLKSIRTDGKLIRCTVKPDEHAHFGRGCGFCAIDRRLTKSAGTAKPAGAKPVPRKQPAVGTAATRPKPSVPPPAPPPVIPPLPVSNGWGWLWLLVPAGLLAFVYFSNTSADTYPADTSVPAEGAMVEGEMATDAAAPAPATPTYYATPFSRYAAPLGGSPIVNLRSSADKSNEGNILTSIPAGTAVSVTGEIMGSDGEIWHVVSHNGLQGYISRSVLAEQPPLVVSQQNDAAAPGSADSTAAPTIYQTSFNCALATARVDRTICRDQKLAELDVRMADAYRQAFNYLGFDPARRNTLQARQSDWRNQRASCMERTGNAGFDCLDALYIRRTDELNAEIRR